MDYLGAAKHYAAMGWRVFPLQPGQKLPRKDTRGVLDATTSTAQIDAWWKQNPNYNIGIACGPTAKPPGIDTPGFLYVLDVDPRHGGDKVLIQLQERHGRLPDTVTVSTGGGGYQFYYAGVPGLRNTANVIGKQFGCADANGRAITGIDTRGEGGYVVAPPSLHPSGAYYQFYKDKTPEDFIRPAATGLVGLCLTPLPLWIQNAVTSGEAVATGAGGRPVAQHDRFRELFTKGAREGGRNDALARMAGYFFRSKIDPLMAADILWSWNQERIAPPLGREEFERTLNSVAKKEMDRIQRRRGPAAGGTNA